MIKQDKLIGRIILIHSALGAIWTFLISSKIGFSAEFIAIHLTLTATGAAAGIGWLKRHRWATYLAILFYLVQIVHVVTPTLQWSFMLGLDLKIHLGWLLLKGELSINAFALTMLALVGIRAFAPNNSFKPTPLRGVA